MAIRIQLILGLALVLLLNSSWVIALIIVVREPNGNSFVIARRRLEGAFHWNLKKLIFDKKLSQISDKELDIEEKPQLDATGAIPECK